MIFLDILARRVPLTPDALHLDSFYLALIVRSSLGSQEGKKKSSNPATVQAGTDEANFHTTRIQTSPTSQGNKIEKIKQENFFLLLNFLFSLLPIILLLLCLLSLSSYHQVVRPDR